jgi:hypothetical protein
MSALDPRVCPLISVLRSLDIVKRVVTVKQVQPFRLAGPGHGYVDRRGASPGGAQAYALVPGRRSQGSKGRDRGEAAVSSLSSDLCPLISDLACLGLGVGELERRASGECLGTERR